MSAVESCCRVCSRGLYSCQWRKNTNKRKHGCCWFSVVALVSLLSLFCMYVCLVAFNDRDDMNWKVFTKLKRWVNWFMFLTIIYAVITTYSILLLLFALLQVALGEQLSLHWLHKIFLFVGVIIIALGIMGITLVRPQEWLIIPLSLQAVAPFLQFGAVGALTLLSPFVFQSFRRTKKGPKLLTAVVFVAVSAAIFLCPLYIHHFSPCLIDLNELPEKPKLFGHRGAPMLAPENTMMSFRRSITCGVTAFETDVQFSKDRMPFLMHDRDPGFLLRTTDVKDVFPDNLFNDSSELTWEQLQRLNAGEWFLKTDPFQSVSQLSEAEKATAMNQTIPSLLQLLKLAQQYNISVIFDIYSHNQAIDAKDTFNTILESKIDPSLILWLPPAEKDAKSNASGFIQFYDNETEMFHNGGNHLNVKYSLLGIEKIRELRRKNVTVNLWVVNERWLFSLLWCAGASSVTTNSCHLLKDMDRPDGVMEHHLYRIIWISVDIASLVIMTALYILQWNRGAPTQYFSLQRERTGCVFTTSVA